MSSKLKATIYVLICVVSWAFIPVVSKFAQTTLDNYQFLFWSSALSLVVLLVSTAIAGKFSALLKYSAKDIIHCFWLGFLGAFLYYVLLYFGYAHAQGLEVLVLQYTWPIFIVIFAAILLKEKITLRKLLAIILGFLGVYVAVTKGNITSASFGNLSLDGIVLIAAAVFGLFSVLSKKVSFEPFSMMTYSFMAATIFSFMTMMVFSHFALPSKESLIPVVVNGAIINGLSYVLWLKALKNAEASYLAVFVFCTPILAALLLVFFFHEPLVSAYIISLVSIVAAAFIAK